MKKLALFLSFLFIVSCSKDAVMYTLTTSANPSDGGTVSPSTQQYEEGETATITATPSAEYVFQSWSGATGSSNSTSVVMNSDKSVTANFVKKKYALTTTVEGEGTVSEKVIKAGAATDYNSGTIVELTAVPSGEWLFVEWKGDLTGSENPKQITIDKVKNVTAVFVKKQYPLSVEIEGEGTVAEKVIKAGAATDYNSGTVVELTATPSDEWLFVEWKGDLTGTDNPKEITIDKAKTVTAVFEAIPESPFYLDDNGVTIKAKDGVSAGTSGKLGGVIYTAVDEGTLRSMIEAREDVSKVVTTLVTDMKSLFRRVSYDDNSDFDISSWDVSNVTNMQSMFNESVFFNGDIGSWDVSSVTNMGTMFRNAQYFNQDLNSWDVSNVTEMYSMFVVALRFNGNVSSWDVSNVGSGSNTPGTLMSMFQQATDFNQDLSGWCVTNYTSEPDSFSFMSALTEANKPIWGTCPGNSYGIAVTASSNADYTLSGEDRSGDLSGNDPNLTFKVGDEVTFSVNAANHPFYLKTVAGTGTGNQISGVTNNGITSGNVVWTPSEAGTYYYQCSAHSGMVGTITIE